MKRMFPACIAILLVLVCWPSQAQQMQTASQASTPQASGQPVVTPIVPRLVQFSGALKDSGGNPLAGLVSVTFAIYSDQEGGTALWAETQNVTADAAGHYSVVLGATSNGVPSELFASGQARWLGVAPANQPEQPRILLVSVPYALKAADANTLGGLPASAFALANPSAPPLTLVSPNPATGAPSAASSTSSINPLTTPCTSITADGTATANLVAKFSAACQIHQSQLFDNGTDVGIGNGTTAPAAKLDVFGTGMFRGALTLPAVQTATSTNKAFNSQPFDLLSSVFNGAAPLNQHFRWQVEGVNPGLKTASGKLNLLFASGAGTPAETGLSISNNGILSFVASQTFPGAGTITGITTAVGSGLAGGVSTGTASLSLLKTCASGQILSWNGTAWACATASGTGTITAVHAGTDLTGGGTTGSVTLNLDTAKVPLLASANTFTASQSVNGNLTASGTIVGANLGLPSTTGPGAGVVTMGGNPFLHACCPKSALNTFLGINVGNFTADASGNNSSIGANTAVGSGALLSITSGFNNTAIGHDAMPANTIGLNNTAIGSNALPVNTTGINNTAIGSNALSTNSSGSDNIASGVNSGFALDGSALTGSNNTFIGDGSKLSTGTLANSTAIGAGTMVAESNALVLGCSGTSCFPGNPPPNVGIGTPSPSFRLHVIDPSNTGLRVETDTAGGTVASFGGFGDFQIDAPGIQGGRFIVKDTSGFVGIGTATPDNTLTVSGSADKPGGGSWGTFSDIRLKNLEGEFHSGLLEVLRLNPVRYRYKEQNALGIKDPEEHVGFVAQEVQKVIPEAVSADGAGYLLVNNDPIMWAMLNAIKEQQKLIRKQQAQLRAQSAEIGRMASQIRLIRASLSDPRRTAAARGAVAATRPHAINSAARGAREQPKTVSPAPLPQQAAPVSAKPQPPAKQPVPPKRAGPSGLRQ